MTAFLLIATPALPLLMLLACLWRPLRYVVLRWLALAPLPGIAAALLAAGRPPLMLDADRLRLTLELGPAQALLLGAAAFLWSMAGAYVPAYLRGKPNNGRFALFWLATLSGSLGVFVAGDLASFYVAFALVSLAAWGLVMHDGTRRARRAGAVYLALAVAGEVVLLAAFVLLAVAAPGDSLAIRDVVAALPRSPWLDATLALLILGFGLKAGLVPLHVWLPVAHPAAPMPASAVLSGAIIKAGIVGLIGFLPAAQAMPGWGETLAAIGLITAWYGIAVGITQDNAKTVLAYSSVSQMGVTTAVLGAAWAAGNAGAMPLAAFYAAHHVLVKGALFLGVGVVAASGSDRLRPVFVPMALLALSVAGLPLSGGAAAKLAVDGLLGDGGIALLATMSAAGSALLMLHFLRCLKPLAAAEPRARAAYGIVLPWAVLGLAAVAVPWALYPAVSGGSPADLAMPASLWKAAWPVLLGAALAWGLRYWRTDLPHLPEGDMVVAGESAVRAAMAWGAWAERAERTLGDWPATGLVLLALTVLMALALGALA